ncbi:DUF3168 domain-containing protein [Marinobacter sp. JSM 1782161]|uniref:DUF3168 domain-containing protein n=1 Tax=Marinobacter sp. JSM 1782161 TaxID=2685906 RepID=UPI0014027DA3|nr:DUF3168 domain-containing protein [Marinobacter sp. JSM 1782161]
MTPPIFQVCAANAAVTALLGTGPTRLFPFGEASQDVALPYAVWQIVGGQPENFLGQAPDIDSVMLQVDVYADDVAGAREVARALRDAIQGHAHIVAWRGESRDDDTNHYRYSFDIEWWVQR